MRLEIAPVYSGGRFHQCERRIRQAIYEGDQAKCKSALNELLHKPFYGRIRGTAIVNTRAHVSLAVLVLQLLQDAATVSNINAMLNQSPRFRRPHVFKSANALMTLCERSVKYRDTLLNVANSVAEHVTNNLATLYRNSPHIGPLLRNSCHQHITARAMGNTPRLRHRESVHGHRQLPKTASSHTVHGWYTCQHVWEVTDSFSNTVSTASTQQVCCVVPPQQRGGVVS